MREINHKYLPPGSPGGRLALPPSGPSQALAACRTAHIVTQYCVGANYTWLLVEGVYLHRLLVLVGGSEEGHFRGYLLLGWGEPRPRPRPAQLAWTPHCPSRSTSGGLPPLRASASPARQRNPAGRGPGGPGAR